MLNASGSRPPKTRRALAAAAAFETEAISPQHTPAPDEEEGDIIIEPPAENEGEHATRELGTEVRQLKYPRRRIPFVLPGQSEIPPMVDDVDNQKSFKMFDAGWILPPDQKRGGRAPVERKPLPPPKKRHRAGIQSPPFASVLS